MSSRNSVPRGASNSTSESNHGLGLVVWGSMLALGLFAGWAYQAEIDQITRGQGQIIASSRTQIIQTPDGGVLVELLVREGAEVQQGELLARLERTKVEASYREAESKVGALSATVTCPPSTWPMTTAGKKFIRGEPIKPATNMLSGSS